MVSVPHSLTARLQPPAPRSAPPTLPATSTHTHDHLRHPCRRETKGNKAKEAKEAKGKQAKEAKEAQEAKEDTLVAMRLSSELAVRVLLLVYDAGWEPEFDDRFPEQPLPLAVANRFWNDVYWTAREANNGFGTPL